MHEQQYTPYALETAAHASKRPETGQPLSRMAVLSPENTYTHEGSEYLAQELMNDPVRPDPSYETITDVVTAVDQGTAPYGFVPRENTSGGAVAETDAALREYDVEIVAELVLPINHALASPEESLGAVETVKSHPQALAQCETYLKQAMEWDNREYEGRTVSKTGGGTTYSTAAAAADLEPGEAAICSELAADNLGLYLLDSGIQDSDYNETRFALLAAGETPDLTASEDYKTTYRITPTADHAGQLVQILRPFADRGVNISYFRSPIIHLELDRTNEEARSACRYGFDLDIDQPVWDPAVRAANSELDGLDEVEAYVTQSYPVYRKP